ncbi:hypothetical protein M407DRAFT_23257 [Tulasnella calospora MUT 4182]|uniref:Uncharacterized protein n=1 Tax=Tulasnella calospora MUT 4182 TaxID=1051891 RepID=A0A0C3QB07_9AGAM|nr:hypothetical protein M407DRAFT_23257 [Tulasnella calospora MUT 4182]
MAANGNLHPANFNVAATRDMEITQPELRHRDEYTQTATDPPLASNQSDSLLPPASQVIESQVPSELSGCLEKVSDSLSHRTGLSKRCYYWAYGEVFQGVLEEHGGSTRAVAMKRMIISEGRDRIDLSQGQNGGVSMGAA